MINKILVVDDSEPERVNLQSIVSDAGYQVLTARSGEEAVQKAKSDRPALIFLDIIMDEMDGYATCRSITKGEDTKDIPVVMVSSKGQKADKMWAAHQGARGYVTKPYTQDQILEQLRRYL